MNEFQREFWKGMGLPEEWIDDIMAVNDELSTSSIALDMLKADLKAKQARFEEFLLSPAGESIIEKLEEEAKAKRLERR